jgi:hypothetical protein
MSITMDLKAIAWLRTIPENVNRRCAMASECPMCGGYWGMPDPAEVVLEMCDECVEAEEVETED